MMGEKMIGTIIDTFYYVHSISLVVSWGLLADFAIIVARFFKHIKGYLLIHATCFVIVDFSTIILVIMMLNRAGDTIEDFLIGCTFLTVLLG